MNNMPKKVVVFAPGFIPSVVIGVLKPLVALEKLGEVVVRLRYSSVSLFANCDIEWCDVAVFCRNCEMTDLEYLYQLKRLGKRVIYEVDDNFEEIPLNTHIGLHHRSFYRLHTLRRFFALADVTRVYSERMKLRANLHGANVSLIRSYFDADIIKDAPSPRRSGVIKIAYPTGRIDDPRLEHMFYEALRQVLLKYPAKIELHLWRKSCPKQLSGINGVVLNKGITSYEGFVRSFYVQGFDIGLAPLVDEPFFHSKSNNKYREFGGCGVAGIYSDMPPYADCVVNEKTGILVENTVEAWVSAIERMIVDNDLREMIAQNSRNDVAENYNFQNAVESFRKALREASSSSQKLIEWLYQKNLYLIASIVDSSLEEITKPELGGRVNSFYLATNILKGNFHPKMFPSELLLNTAATSKSNVIVFIINTLIDLKEAGFCFPLCNSVILDLSQLRCSSDDFTLVFDKINITVPMSWLLDEGQDKFIVYAGSIDIPFAIMNSKASSIENNYSLLGYSAAYLDLIEKHLFYGKNINLSKFQRVRSRISSFQLRIFSVLSSRLFQVRVLIGWRLGKRHL